MKPSAVLVKPPAAPTRREGRKRKQTDFYEPPLDSLRTCKPAETILQKKPGATQVRITDGRGHGLFASIPLTANVIVAIYGGDDPGVRAAELEEERARYTIMDGEGRLITANKIAEETVRAVQASEPVDLWPAACMANNRCVKPNCRFLNQCVHGQHAVALVTERPIEKGEELTAFYGADYKEKFLRRSCLCADCPLPPR